MSSPQAPFLEQVAAHFLAEDLDRYLFVFPSKRAQSFFRHYLGQLSSERPIFAPELCTMSEFVGRLVPERRVLDRTAQLFELYEAYREVRPAEEVESFDDFVYWGNIILQDFDLIDRYLVDPTSLYRNISDLKALEGNFFDYWEAAEEEETLEELQALCEAFWQIFGNPHKGKAASEEEVSERFLAFWRCLAPLYYRFAERLEAAGYTTDGYRYRLANHELEERLELLDGEKQCVFVGLFTVPRAERRILRHLAERGQAAFCWDRRVQIVADKEHPAHRYLARLSERLGAEVKGRWNDPDVPLLPQQITRLITSGRIAETKALPSLLTEHLGLSPEEGALDTAIILPDEGQLLAVANALPESFQQINITLGFPLERTPIALLLQRWMQLHDYAQLQQTRGSYPADRVLSLIGLRLISQSAPLMAALIGRLRRGRFHITTQRLFALSGELAAQLPSEEAADTERQIQLLHLLFDPIDSPLELLERLERILQLLQEELLSRELARRETEETGVEGLEAEASEEASEAFDLEFVYHYQRLLTRLSDLIKSKAERVALSVQTTIGLLDELVRLVTIPFEGNPLRGIQVMGLMETRGIQLEHMIYLSAQDDVLPRDQYTHSLIPVSLRRAFGLPTGSADDPGSDYTFFQTIARARRLVFVASPSDPMGSQSEESRYIKLLRYVYDCPIETLQLQLRSRRQPPRLIVQPKTSEVMVELAKYLGDEGTPPSHHLSPSRLKDYLVCPLSFYYKSVLSISEEDEPELMMRANDFGTVYHEVMEHIYERHRGHLLDAQDFASARRELDRLVEESYAKLYELKDTQQLSPLDQLYVHMIKRYVQRSLEVDSSTPQLQIEAGEAELSISYPLELGTAGRCVGLKGRIDRIDSCAAGEDSPDEPRHYRVVDYKTGQDRLSLKGEGIESLKLADNKAILQTLFYCLLVLHDRPDSYDAAQLYPVIYLLRGDAGLVKRGAQYDGRIKGLERLLSASSAAAEDSEEADKPAKGKGKGTRSRAPLSYGAVQADFEAFLRQQLSELFDPAVPFVQTEDAKSCEHCSFRSLCGR